MNLPEQLEHGKMKLFVRKSHGKSKLHKYLKVMNHRAWRRYKGFDKPMYNRYNGWEL